jgi:hypothetical protein
LGVPAAVYSGKAEPDDRFLIKAAPLIHTKCA